MSGNAPLRNQKNCLYWLPNYRKPMAKWISEKKQSRHVWLLRKPIRKRRKELQKRKIEAWNQQKTTHNHHREVHKEETITEKSNIERKPIENTNLQNRIIETRIPQKIWLLRSVWWPRKSAGEKTMETSLLIYL